MEHIYDLYDEIELFEIFISSNTSYDEISSIFEDIENKLENAKDMMNFHRNMIDTSYKNEEETLCNLFNISLEEDSRKRKKNTIQKCSLEEHEECFFSLKNCVNRLETMINNLSKKYSLVPRVWKRPLISEEI